MTAQKKCPEAEEEISIEKAVLHLLCDNEDLHDAVIAHIVRAAIPDRRRDKLRAVLDMLRYQRLEIVLAKL